MRKGTCIYISILLMAVPLILSVSAEEFSDLPIDEDDIISYWTFDEGEGDNAIDTASGKDLRMGDTSSEHSRDPSWTDGIKGSAFHFDGVDDVAIASDIEFSSPEFTLSFWILTDMVDQERVILSYANIYEVNEFILEDPGDLKVHIRGISRDTGVVLNDGDWHHVVITCDATSGDLRIYKDMKEEFKGTLSAGAPVRTGGTLVLGNDQDEIGGGFEADQAFTGTLDEMILIDHVVDIEDVRDIYEYVLPPPTIIERTPNKGTWPVDVLVNITFNIEMDLGSVEGAFSIEPTINGTFIKDGMMISFVPDMDLENDIEYEVILSKDALDIYGRFLDKGTEFKFRTEKEEVPSIDDDTPVDDDTTVDDDEKGGENDNTWIVIAVLSGLFLGVVIVILVLAFIGRNREDL